MLSYLLISFPALFVTMDTFQMMHMHCWVSALFVQRRTFLGYSIFQVIVFLLGCFLLGKRTAYS
jgi:hypothetical protein